MLSKLTSRRIYYALAIISGFTVFDLMMSKLNTIVIFGAICLVVIIALLIGIVIKSKEKGRESEVAKG